MVALVAPSGAGKSTLLHIAGLLERPDAGEVILDGRACGRLSDDERTAIRRNDIGFVYQFHHLLPEFSALENVVMPQLIAGCPQARRASARQQLLDYMRIGQRADAPAGRALRRRAAARGDRPRRRQRAAGAAGRRADRQSRSGHRILCLRGAGGAGAAVRPGGADRHPQSRACRRAWTAASRWPKARWSPSRN